MTKWIITIIILTSCSFAIAQIGEANDSYVDSINSSWSINPFTGNVEKIERVYLNSIEDIILLSNKTTPKYIEYLYVNFCIEDKYSKDFERNYSTNRVLDLPFRVSLCGVIFNEMFCSTEKLPEFVYRFENLTHFSFRPQNKIDRRLPRLKNLKFLEVYPYESTITPMLLVRFEKLEILKYTNNKLSVNKFPSKIWLNRNLRSVTLSLASSKDDSFPFTWLSQCNNLEELSLTGVGMIKFSSDLNTVGKLKDLTLVSNKIPILGKDLGKLTQLEKLTITDCNVLKLEESSIGKLTNLKFLKLDRNRIEKLPDDISNLINLEILDLSDNNLTDITSLTPLAKLWYLNIVNNQVVKVNIANMIQMKSLKKLRISKAVLSSENILTLRNSLPNLVIEEY
jgi:Leucine-rich repeat (LRR) protein